MAENIPFSRIFFFLTVSVAFIAYLGDAIIKNKIDLAPHVKASSLSNYTSKLKFVINYQVFGVTALLLSIINVVRVRIFTGVTNPLQEEEYKVTASQKILTNTVEQFILTFFTQLLLISYIPVDQLIKLIPFLNFLFFVGRISFMLGYPKYRGIGFMISFFPTSAATFYCFYRFLITLNLLKPIKF